MKNHFIRGALPLALGACAQLPTPLPNVTAQQAVTNSSITTPVNYQNPLSGFTYRGPTEPRDWRTVNEEQTEGH
jgi:hypothetical protein